MNTPYLWVMKISALIAVVMWCSQGLSLADSTELKVKDYMHETPQQKAQRMEWFKEARFGMFIHWGLYSQPAGVWKGKKIPGASEWLQAHAKIPVSEYTPLIKTFNPTKYDPEKWVKLAKDAGMKYIVITTKHHDGFCLYDSQYSDWDIASTPYKKDLLKPLADACRKHGLKICWYHSIMDWHHPYYGDEKSVKKWRGNSTVEKPDMRIYQTYLKNQLQELLTNYGDIGICWFDGEWEGAWTHEMGKDLYNYCRTLQPNTIVNNRVDKGRGGMAGMTKKGFAGDYGTPEQEIPKTGFGPGSYWESCMTMNKSWGYQEHDHKWKSKQDLIHKLIDIASKGGNFLLNVGPTAEGEIPTPSVERLQAMGAWMKVNGEAIHGTDANPFQSLSWQGRCTSKRLDNGNTQLYLHLFKWPKDGKLVVKTLLNKPISATALATKETLPISGKPGEWLIQLPANAYDPIASVIAIEIEGTPKFQDSKTENAQ